MDIQTASGMRKMELLAQALRDEKFRLKLVENPEGIAKDVSLSPAEFKVIADGLAPLRQALGKAKGIDDVGRIVKEHGFDIPPARIESGELSMGELEAVTGGSKVTPTGDDWRQPFFDLVFFQKSSWW